MNEGYKRLYGFDNKSQDNNIKNPQKGSVWNTYLSVYADCGILPIEEAYITCLKSLQGFIDPIIYDKEARCHGAHYNENYEATYNFLRDLDAEKVSVGATNFLGFLERMRKFIISIQGSISSTLSTILPAQANYE
ncbi:MAG: hypothetical protein K2H38_00260 [Muribaculaceae bacterium]|nr:hypothetical protein [Muribaculaceae bacterium]